MPKFDRRSFIASALAMSATPAWSTHARASSLKWTERRDLFPQGVASGDPLPDSVLLWTRRPSEDGEVPLTVEVAEDPQFRKVVVSAGAVAASESDWTVRVLAGGLKPRREYWYRFVGADGAGSRIGRTLTAPDERDPLPVSFAFVSCQNPAVGGLQAYRRMIWEDERASPENRLGFILHLGDFIYEITWYPEDRPQGYFDRRLRDLIRYPHGERVKSVHIPTTLDDYRTAYRVYLLDPDLQDARARFPFVGIWDNHEFSSQGWQGFQYFGEKDVPRQSRKVAANQAWFEFIPARVEQPGPLLGPFQAPNVKDATVTRFDDNGLGQETNNLAAVRSLIGYRSMRYGRHLELIITDNFSFRSREPTTDPRAKSLSSGDFPDLIPFEAMEILDAGRSFEGGHPPDVVRFGAAEIPNFRKSEPAQTILGAEQKSWFLSRLTGSTATWKVWGAGQPTLDWRADPQNLPAGFGKPWPGKGYAGFGGGDYSGAITERADIYDLVQREGVSGFVTVAGDRHSFWAGLAAKALPPKQFQPVGIAFITGSINMPGVAEGNEYVFPKAHPLRPLFLLDRVGRKPEPTINILLKHGVRSCLEYAASGDLNRARALSNPDNAPHVSFVDMAGHGYSVVRLKSDVIETEFVCIPRPTERSAAVDGGPLRYRVVHSARLWKPGEAPVLEQRLIEGDVGLSI